jgi:hypothetical protein
MEILALILSIFGFMAYRRTVKLIDTLKEKGLLDDGYKADPGFLQRSPKAD